MNAKDQIKVCAAGFTILRSEVRSAMTGPEKSFFIKHKTPEKPDAWHTFEKDFASEAAMNRRMTELLKDKMFIQD